MSEKSASAVRHVVIAVALSCHGDTSYWLAIPLSWASPQARGAFEPVSTGRWLKLDSEQAVSALSRPPVPPPR
ncbi:MAG: hypothetical protein NT069_11500 [Planctomycetota bacterium]|nr:hypothetical protein [Planctomycetota bacterium]